MFEKKAKHPERYVRDFLCSKVRTLSVVLRTFRKKNLFSKKSVIQNCILFPTDSIKGFESRIQQGNRTSFRLQLWECKEKQNDNDDDDDDDSHLGGRDAGSGKAEDCEILRVRTDIGQVEGNYLQSSAVE